MDKEYKVYTHRDVNGEIFYVGSGNHYRWVKHNKFVKQRSKKWEDMCNNVFSYEILDSFDDKKESLIAEQELIDILLSEGVKLVNDIRNIYFYARLDEFGRFVDFTDSITMKKEGLNTLNARLVAEGKRHISEGYIYLFKEEYDENKTYSIKGKTVAKSISCYKDKKIIGTYKSASKAMKALFGGGKGDNISRVLRRERKSYKGFTFKYNKDIV